MEPNLSVISKTILESKPRRKITFLPSVNTTSPLENALKAVVEAVTKVDQIVHTWDINLILVA